LFGLSPFHLAGFDRRTEDAMQEGLRNFTFAALRVTSGIILAAHGWLKLTDVPSWQEQLQSLGVGAPHVLAYLAVAGEFLGGLGLIVGLLTPVAALGTACTSAAAIVLVHLGHGLFASQGGFEFPLTLLMVSLFFMAHGGGAWSLDAGLWRALRPGEPQRQPQTEHAPRAAQRPG
jgi:putative oxidoreductase